MFLVQIEPANTFMVITNQKLQVLVETVNLSAFFDAYPNSRLTFEVIKEWKPIESKRTEPKPTAYEPLSR